MNQPCNAMTDEALLQLAGTSQEATETLVRRYSQLVRACARTYFLAGGDGEDLIQEGMIGLLSAISGYEPQRGVPFRAFAADCIRRRMISAIRAAEAAKHSPLNHAVSLEALEQSGPVPTPEELLIGVEQRQESLQTVCGRLSPLERQVLALYLQGLSYLEISRHLNKPVKSVDNAVQRIRRKAARS